MFFTNEDPIEAHWPTIYHKSTRSSPIAELEPMHGFRNTPNTLRPLSYTYGCQIAGHGSEKGIINVFAPLAAGTTTLPPATVGKPINPVQVVVGGMSPYQISGQLFQITDSDGNIIQQGSGASDQGYSLKPSTNNSGVTVTGTPTQVGTYKFTFTVNDAAGRNLQQVQYSMNVSLRVTLWLAGRRNL